MQLVRLYGLDEPAFGLLAGLGAVIVLGLGGALAVRGTISVGAFVAFGLYLGMLTWPLIALGWVVNLFQRGAASMARLLEILDARAGDRRPAGTRVRFRPRRPDARSSSATSDFTIPPPERRASRAGCCATSRSRVPRGRDARRRRRDGQRQERADRSHPALVRSAGRRDPDRRRADHVARRSTSCAARSASCRRRASCSARRSANLAYGDATSSSPSWTSASDESRARRDAAPLGGEVAQLDETIARISGRVRHDARRTRHQPLGRPETACRAGARPRATTAIVAARRRAVRGGYAHGGGDSSRAARRLEGRTAIIASHRVSAVRDASWIIVLDEGRIVEQGRTPS